MKANRLSLRSSTCMFLMLASLLAGCGGSAEPEPESPPDTNTQRPPDAPSPPPPQTPNVQTVINGKPLTDEQRAAFVTTYGTQPLGGDFWYDTRSGLWGVTGREAFGVLRPGHDYGPLAATASAGTTGIFINNRQINTAEALYIQRLLGSVLPGRWWFDGATGYFGVEGNPAPAGNVLAAARAAQAQGGGSHYYNDGMGTSVAVSSGCASGSTGTGSSRINFIVGCD